MANTSERLGDLASHRQLISDPLEESHSFMWEHEMEILENFATTNKQVLSQREAPLRARGRGYTHFPALKKTTSIPK